MCKWCRNNVKHPTELCPTLELIWDKTVDMVDGLDSRSGSDKKPTSLLTCARPRCLKPRVKGSTRCLKHTNDVNQKRKKRKLSTTPKTLDRKR